MRWFTVAYVPHPSDKNFLDRAQVQTKDDLEVTLAVMSDRESKQYFGVPLASRGLQPVWVRCVNHAALPYRLDFYSVDPTYYTPLEAAYINHFSLGERLVSYGLLAWVFLPLLPLLPFKLVGAWFANRRMDAFFKQESFRFGPIASGEERSGFIFTSLDEGTKNVDIVFVAQDKVRQFSFSLHVPGLRVRDIVQPADGVTRHEMSADQLQSWLRTMTRCATNKKGTVEADPLNLVVVGDRVAIRQCFGARWDETEAIMLSTCLKTGWSFLFDAAYRYSPVSSLYWSGRIQDLALQKARTSINERIHLRLWETEVSFQQQPVWIGQISRDIGVRLTPKTWNLTTHRIDPDVDEARDYLVDYLMVCQRLSAFGYIDGVESAPVAAPRRNLTGDPYFTDGKRAVLVLSPRGSQPEYLNWS